MKARVIRVRLRRASIQIKEVRTVRTKLMPLIFLLAVALGAKEARFYEKGTLAEMNAVECGYEEKGGKGVTGALLGTDDEHRKTQKTLCQEYVLRSDRMAYKIRPREEKHPFLLPVGEQVEFRISKDRLYLRVPELDSHERQFYVTSMTPRTDATTTPPPSAAKTAEK